MQQLLQLWHRFGRRDPWTCETEAAFEVVEPADCDSLLLGCCFVAFEADGPAVADAVVAAVVELVGHALHVAEPVAEPVDSICVAASAVAAAVVVGVGDGEVSQVVVLQTVWQPFEQHCSWVLHHSIAAATVAAVVVEPFAVVAVVDAFAALAFGKLAAGLPLVLVDSLISSQLSKPKDHTSQWLSDLGIGCHQSQKPFEDIIIVRPMWFQGKTYCLDCTFEDDAQE